MSNGTDSSNTGQGFYPLTASRLSVGENWISYRGTESKLPVFLTQKIQKGEGVLPVFFSGAVTQRGRKKGPFFSGKEIARRLQTPCILIADPVIDEDSSLNLSWYAGSKRFPALPRKIASLIDGISSFFDKQPLLIGGSGGGFASLLVAHHMENDASVFCWNPQTNILKYNPEFVIRYLRVAFGQDFTREEVSSGASRLFLAKEGVDFELPSPLNVKRFLVAQSTTDWHVQHHSQPLVLHEGLNSVGTGTHQRSKNQVLQFGDWSEGHLPPPAELIERGIRAFMDTSVSSAMVNNLVLKPALKNPSALAISFLGRGQECWDNLRPILKEEGDTYRLSFDEEMYRRYFAMGLRVSVNYLAKSSRTERVEIGEDGCLELMDVGNQSTAYASLSDFLQSNVLTIPLIACAE